VNSSELNNHRTNEVFVDPDIYLTTMHIPLLKITNIFYRDEYVCTILNNIIIMILRKGFVVSHDIENILQKLNVGSIGIHFYNEISGCTHGMSGSFHFFSFPGKLFAYLASSKDNSNADNSGTYIGPSLYLFLPLDDCELIKHNGETIGSYYSTVFVAGYHGAIRRYINTTGEIIYEFQGIGLLTFLTPWKYQKQIQ
jgi:hypothetical protein